MRCVLEMNEVRFEKLGSDMHISERDALWQQQMQRHVVVSRRFCRRGIHHKVTERQVTLHGEEQLVVRALAFHEL